MKHHKKEMQGYTPPPQLEKIFSDSEESSTSRLEDSLLEQFNFQAQKQQQQQTRHFRQQHPQPKQDQLQRYSSSCNPDIRHKPIESWQQQNQQQMKPLVIGGSNDKSMFDDSLLNIYKDLGGTTRRAQQSLSQKELEYQNAMKLMQSLQKQLEVSTIQAGVTTTSSATKSTALSHSVSQAQSSLHLQQQRDFYPYQQYPSHPASFLLSSQDSSVNNKQQINKAKNEVRRSSSINYSTLNYKPQQHGTGSHYYSDNSTITPKLRQMSDHIESNSMIAESFFRQRQLERQFISEEIFQKMAEKELPMFCITCEEYVKLIDIDKHSAIDCLRMTKTKVAQQHKPQQQSVMEELENINRKILQIDMQLKVRQVTSVLPLSHALRSCSNFSSPQLIDEILAELSLSRTRINGLSQTTDNIPLLILIDRLQLLGEEKANIIKQTSQEQYFSQQLRVPSSIHQKNNPQFAQKFHFEQDNITRYTSNSSYASSLQSDWMDKQNNAILRTEGPVSQNSENLKKYFFKMVLDLKYTLPHNHPAKQAQIQDLYALAQQLQIPTAQWPVFIKRTLLESNNR